jgi:hypothetical protein
MPPTDTTDPTSDRLTRTQRDALWTWTWLGWRGSTLAFKASLALAAVALAGIVAYWALAR